MTRVRRIRISRKSLRQVDRALYFLQQPDTVIQWKTLPNLTNYKSLCHLDGVDVDDPRVESVEERGAVDDGHAEEEADVAPDLGVKVGQGVVLNRASCS